MGLVEHQSEEAEISTVPAKMQRPNAAEAQQQRSRHSIARLLLLAAAAARALDRRSRPGSCYIHCRLVRAIGSPRVSRCRGDEGSARATGAAAVAAQAQARLSSATQQAHEDRRRRCCYCYCS